MLYDVFICHASEDKESLVRPLAEALRAENVEVWYDEFSLTLGDSIRQSIDRGLRQSRFGVIVLSRAFFRKRWPQCELDGLVEREMRGEDRVLLPVWHNVSGKVVVQHVPALAGRKATLSSSGIGKVVGDILAVIRPQGSPLIQARDILLNWGVVPPVITDEYWLDVVEASNRLPGYGAAIPSESTWDRWSFPLPESDRGQRLAWTAMQMRWTTDAERHSVTPLTSPKRVLRFIHTHPGLAARCRAYPDLLVEYAPQLTIPGFEGEFAASIEAAFLKSCSEARAAAARDPRQGSALTVNGTSPLCSEEWAIRHPTFGNHQPGYVTEAYFSGGIFGPRVSPYDHAEHLFWLLSSTSAWLPPRVHQTLLDGMADSPVWVWPEAYGVDQSSGGLGALQAALLEASEGKKDFRWTRAVKEDVLERIHYAISVLKLRDQPKRIFDAFVELGLPGRYIAAMKKRRKPQSPTQNRA